jgi:hypothetical protein
VKKKPRASIREAARKKAAWHEWETAVEAKKLADSAWGDTVSVKSPGARFIGIDNLTDAKLTSPSVTVTRIPDKAVTALGKIRQRAADLQNIRANYLRYQDDRVREHDHHGAWGVAINLAETEAEIAGLQFAEKALG